MIDDDDKAAVGEVERGEDYLLKQVRHHAEDHDVSSDTWTFLRELTKEIQPVHDQISALKKTLQ